MNNLQPVVAFMFIFIATVIHFYDGVDVDQDDSSVQT